MIEPTPSVRAQIIDIVRARPGISSREVSEALPHVERRAICADLATLTRKGRMTRDQAPGGWRYTATADTPVMPPAAMSTEQSALARIDSDGALEIAGTVRLSAEHTRQLGEFLMLTSALWSRP